MMHSKNNKHKHELNVGGDQVPCWILRHIHDGVWIANANGVIEWVNPAFLQITGVGEADLIGSPMFPFPGIPGHGDTMELIHKAVVTTGEWTGELVCRKQSGHPFPARFTLKIIRDDSTEIRFFVGILTDISQNHELEILKLEMERARQAHNLIIQPHLPELSGVQYHIRCIPAEMIGGDVMELFQWDDHTLIMLVADITGHGISAAMVAHTLKILFREICETQSDPMAIFKHLNRILYDSVLPEVMIAAFCGRIDLKAMAMDYCLNGIPPPYILRQQEIIRIQPTGFPLGVFKDPELYSEHLSIAPADVLVVFSDGIPETRSSSGNPIGTQGVEHILEHRPADDPQSIVETIISRCRELQDHITFADDVIVMALRVLDGDDAQATTGISRSNIYSFESRSICQGKTRFFFIDDVVDFFINYVSEQTRQSQDELGWLKIALFEVVLNAIEHGNLEMTKFKHQPDFYDSPDYWALFDERMKSQEFGNRRVNIDCQVESDGITFHVEDQGPGFDTKTVLESWEMDQDDLYKPSGRGLALARMYVNRLWFNEKGNRVSFFKKLP